VALYVFFLPECQAPREPCTKGSFYLKVAGCCNVLGVKKGCANKNRLLFHLSHKFGDEKRLMSYHQNLQDVIEDQLSLASIHYLRSHYQEAIDTYKRILLDNRYVLRHFSYFKFFTYYL